MAICVYIKNQKALGLEVSFSGRAPAYYTQGYGSILSTEKEKDLKNNLII
jgi:hypothetical protein